MPGRVPRRAGAPAVGESGPGAHGTLAGWRPLRPKHLAGRLPRAGGEGGLPAGADPEFLARYVMTVANGMSVQAAGGATRDQLHRVADAALRGWPWA